MKAAPLGLAALMARMPRWFVDHARKTDARSRRRRAAQAARFELAYAGVPSHPLATPAPVPPACAWPDTVAAWEPH